MDFKAITEICIQNMHVIIMQKANISSILCFSNQCYFHRAFCKLIGITPLQYRKEA